MSVFRDAAHETAARARRVRCVCVYSTVMPEDLNPLRAEEEGELDLDSSDGEAEDESELASFESALPMKGRRGRLDPRVG